MKKPVYKHIRTRYISGGGMRTAVHKPKFDSFAPEMASLTPKRTIFYERPVLVGADHDGHDWKEVGFTTKNSGKFIVGASGANMDRVRLYGIVYAKLDPETTELELMEQGHILPLLGRLRKLKDSDMLVLGGGILSIVHEPLAERTIIAGGLCGEFGQVTKSMLKSALSMLERKGEAGADNGYRLEIHANDTIMASDIVGSALKRDEVLDWLHSAHILVG